MRGLSAARAARNNDEDMSRSASEAPSPKHAPNFYDKVKDARRRATRYLSLLPPPEDEDTWKRVGRCMKGIDPGAQSRGKWVKWTGKFKDRKYCQMVWETFFREKRGSAGGGGGGAGGKGQKAGHRRSASGVSNASSVNLSNVALASTSGFSVGEKLLNSIHRRICKEDTTKLVSKQLAVKTKQANLRDGRAAEDTGSLPNFQRLLRRTITNFFKTYALSEEELAAVNAATKELNLSPVVEPDDDSGLDDEKPAFYITQGLFQKLLEEKLGVPVTSQKQSAEMVALLRLLAGLPPQARLGSKRIRRNDIVEVHEVATGDWFRAEVESVNPDDTYSVVLRHRTTVPLDSRDPDDETAQQLALLNRKCMWRRRVVPPNIHHYVAVSLHAFLKFIARSDEAETAKQEALARAQACLRELKVLARDVVAAANEAQRLREGGVPRQPVLEAIRLGEDSAWVQMTTLRLHWQAAPFSDPVSFFMVETCGTDGARSVNKTQWRTLLTDPPNANAEATCAYNVTGLGPGASYTFRVRAFNQHGASPYTFRTFTTMPAPPPIPIVQQLAPTKLVLSWRLDKNQDVVRLKNLFHAIDADNSGRVSKQELLDCMETNEDARTLLATTFASRRAIRSVLSLSAQLSTAEEASSGHTSGQQISVLECIESLDVVDMSWQDFLKLFGRPERDRSGASVNGIPTSQLLGDEAGEVGSGELKDYRAKMKGSTQSKDLNYIVQRLHGATQEWRDLCTSRKTSCTIVGVAPGDRWSYRVVSINRLGQRSVPSESIMVAQPLPKPPPPQRAPGRSVAESAVVLSLKADPSTEAQASQIVGTASGTTISVEDILKRWALGGSDGGDGLEGSAGASKENLWGIAGDEHGVARTIDDIFSKFDTDGSGTIDSEELRLVLLELGAPAGPEAVAAAMERLDQDRSGSISREEFAEWWRQDKFDFVVFRDGGVPGDQVALLNPKHISSVAPDAVASATHGVRPGSARRSNRQRSKRRNRRDLSGESKLPMSPARVGIGTSDGGGPLDMAKLKLPGIAKGGTCFMCYRGRVRTPLITDLQPSTLYRFRLQVFKNNVSSLPSQDLAIMTVPQKVRSGPVLLDRGARWLRLKWSPAFTGAFAFRLQWWVTDDVGGGLLGSGARWETVWQGMDTTTEIAGLAANTQYRFRVVALNVAGGESEPSDTLEAVTLSIADGIRNRLSIRKANQRFCVPCSGDIVVGDTILFREAIPRRDIELKGREACENLSGTFLRQAQLLLSPEYSRGWVRTLAVRIVGESVTKRSAYQFNSKKKAAALKMLENRKRNGKRRGGRHSKSASASTALTLRSASSRRSEHSENKVDRSENADSATGVEVEDITADEAMGANTASSTPRGGVTPPGTSTAVVSALLGTSGRANRAQHKKNMKRARRKKFQQERVLHMQVVLCEMSSEDRLDPEAIRQAGDPLHLLYVEGEHGRSGGDASDSPEEKQPPQGRGLRGKVRVDYDKLWEMQYEFARAHALSEGARILRTEGDAIYQFEVFRTEWEQEALRVPYRVDWKAEQEWGREQAAAQLLIKDAAATQSGERREAAKREKRSLAEERRRRHRLAENEPRLRKVVDDLGPIAAALPALPTDEPTLKLIAELGRLVQSVTEDQSKDDGLLQEARDMSDGFNAAKAAAAEDSYAEFSDEDNSPNNEEANYGDEDGFDDSYGSTPRAGGQQRKTSPKKVAKDDEGAAGYGDDYEDFDDDVVAAVAGDSAPSRSPARAVANRKGGGPVKAAQSKSTAQKRVEDDVDDVYEVVGDSDIDDDLNEAVGVGSVEDDDLVEEVVDDDLVVDDADDSVDDVADEIESVE